MNTRTIVLAGMLVFLLIAPMIVGSASAAPIPSLFVGENTSLLCISTYSASTGFVFVLVQVNFDQTSNGGISFSQANSLFHQVRVLLAGQSSLATEGCAYSPTDMKGFKLDAFGLVSAMAPVFLSYGFSAYVVLDAYLFSSPSFTGSAPVLRLDAYQVNGANNVTFQGAAELLRSLVF